jgi:hypothetical protein
MRIYFVGVLFFSFIAADPASAAAYVLQPGAYQVLGDFGPSGHITGSVSFNFSATVNPGNYDPLNGPFYGYFASVTANSGSAQGCSFSQIGSMCGRSLRPPLPLDVFDFDGDGMGSLFVSGSVSVTNMTVSTFDIIVILPAGFTIAAPVPEPSTWAMLLIGFAGVGFVTYRGRRSASLAA